MRSFTNLYGCKIGSRSRVGTFVEIQRGAEVGSDCKIESHSFVCEGVTIGDEVFIVPLSVIVAAPFMLFEIYPAPVMSFAMVIALPTRPLFAANKLIGPVPAEGTVPWR